MNGLRTTTIPALGLMVVLGGAAALGVGAGTENGEWRFYSGDNGARKYSPLDQINKSNVTQLGVAWRSPAVEPVDLLPDQARPSNLFRSTPIMVNGVLYASNGVGSAIALDPATGKSLWRQPPDPGTPPGFTSNRGLAYWRDGSDERIISHRTHFLYALDPKTGAPIKTFGKDGRIDLNDDLTMPGSNYAWTSAPLIVRDVVVMGQALGGQDSARQKEGEPGHVRAYDVRTGKLRWTFHVIPQGREPGVETWEEEAWRYTGAGNVWSLMSADDDLGYVYVPTTSPTHDMYGGHRLGANLYSTSIVCIDAKTGRRVWHYQTVHHDLFDYDNPSAPVVMDLNVEGKGRVKAVVQMTKQGFAFVFDRTSGKPVWPIEERPVPKSDVPGEQSWPTQPFPTKPPAVEWQGVTEDLLIDFTPELRREALEIVKRYRIGPLFTPPSIEGPGANDRKGTIQNPGSVGGPDWTGSAYDPDTQTLYVHTMTNPFVANLVPGDPKETNLRYRASRRQLIDGPQGLPLLKPPYGRIVAIDLGKGTLRWTIAHGDGPRDHPAIKHLNLPPLGNAVRSAPLVTKTLLFATEGDAVNIRVRPGMGGRTFWAYDKSTGERLSKVDLEAGATGAPMTYLHKGKQYIVFAIGSPRHPAELVALSLP
jgi:quinoprotein glucose dehydrogenase